MARLRVLASIWVTLLAGRACAEPYPHGAVAADHPLASQAGASMLERGGNAVDAAVAASFALSVVRPYSCGIGGGGFMVIHLGREHPRGPLDTTVNYREICPRKVGGDFFVQDANPRASEHGGKSVAVPGTVAGLLYVLEKYGTLPREQVLAPAIRLAEEGFAADDHYAASAKEQSQEFRRFPGYIHRFGAVWNTYLHDGSVPRGARIMNPSQAEAFRAIAQRGKDGFYRGPVADALLQAVRSDGGVIEQADLDEFHVVERPPLSFAISGDRTVLSMPLPSSGGIALLQTLAVVDRLHTLHAATGGLGPHNSTRYVHLVSEALAHAFADRSRFLNDTDCATCTPVDMAALTDPAMLRARADSIALDRATLPGKFGVQLPDDHGTSHLCVVDGRGNAVACTETVNLLFGSMLIAAPFGFVLNDEMDDFTTHPAQANAFALKQSNSNLPAPGKRPLSSMTPTIVLRGSDADIVAGASGGPRIISGTAESILNVLYFDMSAERAVSEPRFHHQYSPNRLELEDAWRQAATAAELASMGHVMGHAHAVGNVQLIRRVSRGYDAACDPRKGGRPAGN